MTRILESQIEYEAGLYIVVRINTRISPYEVRRRMPGREPARFVEEYPTREQAVTACNFLARKEKAGP